MGFLGFLSRPQPAASAWNDHGNGAHGQEAAHAPAADHGGAVGSPALDRAHDAQRTAENLELLAHYTQHGTRAAQHGAQPFSATGTLARSGMGGLGVMGGGLEMAHGFHDMGHGETGLGAAQVGAGALGVGNGVAALTGASSSVPLLAPAAAFTSMLTHGEKVNQDNPLFGKDESSGKNLTPFDLAARATIGTHDWVDEKLHGNPLAPALSNIAAGGAALPSFAAATAYDVGTGVVDTAKSTGGLIASGVKKLFSGW